MKKFLSLILTVTLLVAFASCNIVYAENVNIKVGDYIQMGTYYDETILWRCVDIDENGPLMLSDKILCYKAFDTTGEHTNITNDDRYSSDAVNFWEFSNIRSWLNSNDRVVKWKCGNPPDTIDEYENWEPYSNEAGFLANFRDDEISCIANVTHKVPFDSYNFTINSLTYKDESTGGEQRGKIADYIVHSYDCYMSTDLIFLINSRQAIDISNNLGESYLKGIPTQAAIDRSLPKTIERYKNYWYVINPGFRPDCSSYIYGDDSIYFSDGWYSYGGSAASLGIRPAFYLNKNINFISGNGTEREPYTIESKTKGQQPLVFSNALSITLGNLPHTLYVRGIDGVTFTTDNNDIISLQPTSLTQLGAKQAVSAVWVTGKTPGTAIITATAPDGRTAQCVVTVNGQIAETISDEMIIKAKVCANNGDYKFMRDAYVDPSSVLIDSSGIFYSKLYQNINDFLDFCSLNYSATDYYEVALMDMLSRDNNYYEIAKDIINNEFVKTLVDQANNKLHDNLNANKVNISGLNCFDIDKFYTDVSFLDVILAGKDVTDSMYKKFEQIYALSLVTDEQIKMLEMIKDSTLNEDLKNACDKVIKVQADSAQQTANEIAYNTAFAGIEELGSYVGKRGWNGLLALIPGMKEAKLIVEGGKLVSNGLYNADSLSTDILTMAASTEILETVKSCMKNEENKFLKNSTKENALKFMAVANSYKALCLYGCDAAIDFENDVEYAQNAQNAFDMIVKVFPNPILKSFSDLNDILVKDCDVKTIEELEGKIESIKSMTNETNFYDPCGDDVTQYIRTILSTTPSEWAKPYIDKAINYTLLPEEYQNNYQNNITRAEFCTLLSYMIGAKSDESSYKIADRLGKPKITVQFDDVLYPYVSEIAMLGIINGTGNNKFEPLGEITREQAAKMLCETAKILGYDTSAPQTDLSNVSDWAKEGANFVVARGIMTGTDNGFEPQGTYTKEQAITTMVRFFENLN